MWPRVVEVILGCWLAMSPFIFRYGPDETFLWANDFATAAVVVAIGLLGCWPRLEKIHFLQLAVSAYLVVVAFLAAPPPPPAPYQNYVCVGLLLLIVGVLPSRGALPPRSWQAFYEERGTHPEGH